MQEYCLAKAQIKVPTIRKIAMRSANEAEWQSLTFDNPAILCSLDQLVVVRVRRCQRLDGSVGEQAVYLCNHRPPTRSLRATREHTSSDDSQADDRTSVRRSCRTSQYTTNPVIRRGQCPSCPATFLFRSRDKLVPFASGLPHLLCCEGHRNASVQSPGRIRALLPACTSAATKTLELREVCFR